MREENRWVRQAKRGDREAFGKLYALVYEELYRYALYALGRREDAEDAVAETVVAAFRGIGELRDAAKFRGWIFRILSNRCNRALRLRYGETPTEHTPDPPVDGDVAEEMSLRAVLAARLTDEERQIILLHVLAGYKSHEIGEILGIKPATVRSKEHRALARLREELAG